MILLPDELKDEATNTDEYVPTNIPTNNVILNVFNVSPPRIRK